MRVGGCGLTADCFLLTAHKMGTHAKDIGEIPKISPSSFAVDQVPTKYENDHKDTRLKHDGDHK